MIYTSICCIIIVVIFNQMSQTLLNKMRQLSIKQLKSRRQQLFQKTRNIIDKKSQSQNENIEESGLQQESNHQMTKYQKINEEISPQYKRKSKKKQRYDKFKSYWKKLLQISDWMIEIPQNLIEYYVASRPDGNKCLLIFSGYKIEIRNKSGNMVMQFEYPNKMYDGTIMQGYLNLQLNRLVISDLIVWKNYPFTSYQFQFRMAWIISNISSLNINILMQSSKLQINLISYQECNQQNLKRSYQQILPYPKEGLIFVHKNSLYVHGLNPESLIWKDLYISKYLIKQIEQNRQSSNGIAYLTKTGDVKSLQGIILFKINRQNFNLTHRYIKFVYKQIFIDNVEGDDVTIHFDWINIVQTVQYFNNSVDSISKLLYKCKINHQSINIQQILDSFSYFSNMKQLQQ